MRFIRTWPVKLIILIVSLIAIVSLSGSIWDAWRRGGALGERQRALAEVEAENKALKTKLEEVQTPGFIEREARNKLGMTREGETVIVIPQGESSVVSHQSSDGQLSNWKLWVGLFY